DVQVGMADAAMRGFQQHLGAGWLGCGEFDLLEGLPVFDHGPGAHGLSPCIWCPERMDNARGDGVKGGVWPMGIGMEPGAEPNTPDPSWLGVPNVRRRRLGSNSLCSARRSLRHGRACSGHPPRPVELPRRLYNRRCVG